MRFAGVSVPRCYPELPFCCVLTIRYLEITLFASLIRHVVRTLTAYIFVSANGGEGSREQPEREREREREREEGERETEESEVEIEAQCIPPAGAYTDVRTCTLDIDPGT